MAHYFRLSTPRDPRMQPCPCQCLNNNCGVKKLLGEVKECLTVIVDIVRDMEEDTLDIEEVAPTPPASQDVDHSEVRSNADSAVQPAKSRLKRSPASFSPIKRS